jgi:hypothetical protein
MSIERDNPQKEREVKGIVSSRNKKERVCVKKKGKSERKGFVNRILSFLRRWMCTTSCHLLPTHPHSRDRHRTKGRERGGGRRNVRKKERDTETETERERERENLLIANFLFLLSKETRETGFLCFLG